MWEHAPVVFLGPLNDTILYLNKSKIIGNGGELSDLEYLPTKTEKVKYLQNAKMRSYHLLGTLNNIIADSNKPKIIRNGRELTDLDYLLSKQKIQNISKTQTCEPLVSSGLVLPCFFTGSFFDLFIQSTVFARILHS